MSKSIYLSYINSSRNGVNDNLVQSTLIVGRSKEISEIESCLKNTANGLGSIKILCGEFGSGKSLILKTAKEIALTNNFLVVNLSISNGFKLNNLQDFYYHIMHNLSISSGTKARFDELFNVWLEKLRSVEYEHTAQNEIQRVIGELSKYNQSMAHAFVTYIKATISKDNETANWVSTWLMGEQNIPAQVKAKFDIKGNIDKMNSMDFFKGFTKLIELLGFSGVLVNIDEVGLLLNERSDIRKRSYENLRYIIDSLHDGSFTNCMFLLGLTPDTIEDCEKGFYSSPALYQRLGNLANKSTYGDFRQTVMYLKPFSRTELLSLSNNIIVAHENAYDWKTQISHEAICNWVLFSLSKGNLQEYTVNTRAFVMKLTEILDIIQQSPKFNIYNSELKIVLRDGKETFVNSMRK